MQQLSSTNTQSESFRGGGRIASDHYRQSLELCEQFTGLEENTNRYDLLLLAKRVGKEAGFTPRMIQLLDYYMAFTTELDWEEGSRPIVYQSLSKTAMDLGVTERQIQNLEKQLFEIGAITWNDSGNHKRYGKRDPVTNRILYAYGVDLTPLAYLKPELEDKLHQKQLYMQAWQDTKRQISTCRRQIRALLLEWQEEGAEQSQLHHFEQSYQEIAVQLRTHIPLNELRSLLERHQSLCSSLMLTMGVGTGNSKQKEIHSSPTAQIAQKSSTTSEPDFAHNQYIKPTNNNTCSPLDTCFQKSVVEYPEPNDLKSEGGLQYISLKQVLLCASGRFREQLPLEPRPMNWNDVIEAAYRLRMQLGISQKLWAEACELLDRTGAAICLLLTDHATQRLENRVTQPAAYFRGMINKARVGELRLQNSVFGILERQHLKNVA